MCSKCTVEDYKMEFADILVDSNFGSKDEPAAVGVVERPHRLVELVVPGVPGNENTAVVGLAIWIAVSTFPLGAHASSWTGFFERKTTSRPARNCEDRRRDQQGTARTSLRTGSRGYCSLERSFYHLSAIIFPIARRNTTLATVLSFANWGGTS